MIIMSLQKFVSGSIIVLLLCINLFFCTIILRNSNSQMPHNSAAQDELLYYTESAANLNKERITLTIVSIIPNLIHYKSTILFIPPNPCGACVDTQNQTLAENSAICQALKIVILVPKEWERDIKSQLFEIQNIQILPYDTNFVSDDMILRLQSPVFFQMNKTSIEDIFITSIWNTQATISYLESHL